MSIKNIIPQKIKNIYHLGQAILANFVYGWPGKRIKVIGVTGTNGKTTTVWMIGKILEEAGYKVAINSTINFQIGEKKWVNQTKFTTLSSFAVQKFIKEAVEEKCDYLVLETSSHSLDQFRVWGIPYAVAVITNVTREHLDYHQTMEEYRKAKSKLFKNLKSNFQFSIFNFQSIFNDKILEKNKKVSVVNLDMERPEEFLQFNDKDKLVYTCHPERIRQLAEKSKDLIKLDSSTGLGMTNGIIAQNIELGINYSKFEIQNSKFTLNLPGRFNVENALAATCVGLSQNISPETIKNALEKIQGIPGRMEYVPNDKGLNIIIDYALTPDSLEKLYDLINQIKNNVIPVPAFASINSSGLPAGRQGIQSAELDSGSEAGMTSKKVIAVFGSCGERDRGKRPLMGAIVARTADYVIITNEDPYNEDPNQIINEVFSGVVKNPLPDFASAQSTLSLRERGLGGEGKMTEGVNVWRILDRREAIKKALTLAQPGDFVIITGKGAEETMAIGKERIPWKERKVIEEELNKI